MATENRSSSVDTLSNPIMDSTNKGFIQTDAKKSNSELSQSTATKIATIASNVIVNAGAAIYQFLSGWVHIAKAFLAIPARATSFISLPMCNMAISGMNFFLAPIILPLTRIFKRDAQEMDLIPENSPSTFTSGGIRRNILEAGRNFAACAGFLRYATLTPWFFHDEIYNQETDSNDTNSVISSDADSFSDDSDEYQSVVTLENASINFDARSSRSSFMDSNCSSIINSSRTSSIDSYGSSAVNSRNSSSTEDSHVLRYTIDSLPKTCIDNNIPPLKPLANSPELIFKELVITSENNESVNRTKKQKKTNYHERIQFMLNQKKLKRFYANAFKQNPISQNYHRN